MRCSFLSLTLVLIGGFSPASAQPEIRLTLVDQGLPLQLLQPNDRRVYVVALAGRWEKLPPGEGLPHYVNVYFPGGHHYAHGLIFEKERFFNQGEVRVMLVDYQLKHGFESSDVRGELQVAVSFGKPAPTLDSPDLICEPIRLNWPMYRPVLNDVVPIPPLRPRPPMPMPMPQP
jgi:hypothetical protein